MIVGRRHRALRRHRVLGLLDERLNVVPLVFLRRLFIASFADVRLYFVEAFHGRTYNSAGISELFVVDEVPEVPVEGLGTGACRFDMRKKTIDETMTIFAMTGAGERIDAVSSDVHLDFLSGSLVAMALPQQLLVAGVRLMPGGAGHVDS